MDTEVRPPADSQPVWGLPAAMLVAGLTTAVIAVPYWSVSYDSVRDDGIFAWFWLVELVVLLGTTLAGAVSHAPLAAVMALMLACVPIAVVGRVVIDTASDPTSHNLWPLEVVLAIFMTLPPICVGGLLAWAIRRASPGPG